MTCDESRQFLHPYLDDELDLTTALRVEAHLPGCLRCQKALESARIVREAVASRAPYFSAPPEFRERIQRAVRSELNTVPPATGAQTMPVWWKRPMALSGLAAGVVLALGAAMLFWQPRTPNAEVVELVDAHLRSLEPARLMDVESTDQHTVKPWFAGKLDFSPPVIDLADQGFPLIGGRVDYVDHTKVAALIYRHGKHVINVFVWPGSTSPQALSMQGFNLVRFACRGMNCWAVSDLNAAELQKFADRVGSQKPATERS